MRFISAILLLAFFIVLIALACVNAETVTINYYFGKIQIALSFAIGLSVVIGFLIGLSIVLIVYLRQKSQQLKLKQQLKKLKKELDTLRVIIAKDT